MLNIQASHSSLRADRTPCVHVSGAKPGTMVRIGVSASDARGETYRSKAVFRADIDGAVNSATSWSHEGDYQGIDRSGLFWSMSPDSEDLNTPAFSLDKLNSFKLSMSAEQIDSDTSFTTQTDHKVVLLEEGLETKNIREDGIMANVFQPANRCAKDPVIFVLGGYGGKFRWSNGFAKLMASRGLATVAIGYTGFGKANKAHFGRIDLTYFDKVIEKLSQLKVVEEATPLGLLGCSMGGQLALLLASRNPRFKAISVCGAPTYVTSSVGDVTYLLDTLTPKSFRKCVKACWLDDGRILPFAKARFDLKNIYRFLTGQGVEFSASHKYIFRNPERFEHARIPIENINGPVQFFSGGDDRLICSAEFAETAIDRAGTANKSRFEHFHYSGGAHIFRLPNTPTTGETFKSVFKVNMGGNPAASAAANMDHWRRMVGFFKEHLSA